jgi:hypothetical protein
MQRLGDVLTAARVTDAWSRRRTTSMVEVIHWDATGQAAALLPGVSATWALPYNGLRKATRAHALAPLHRLYGELSTMLGDTSFDRVINLSSTRFACWLAPLLAAPGAPIHGPSIDGTGRYHASAPAVAYLNEWGVDPDLDSFAHHDLYAMAAQVRLSGWAGLRDGGGSRRGPIVLHPFGSERAKDWRTPADWRALVGQLGATFGLPVVIIGAPGEREVLDFIAQGTAAKVVTTPLSSCVELLSFATGLVSVDTVAIHLAAMVSCPAVVLRQGPARGSAFIAGTQSLCVDARSDAATAEEVVALAERQFADAPAPWAPTEAAVARLRIHEGHRDDGNALGLRTPAWCREVAPWSAEDRSDGAWRALWHAWFTGAPLPDVDPAILLGAGPRDERRWRELAARGDALGQWARERSPQARGAA